MAEAAILEAREETGLEVELSHLVGVYSRPHWFGDHDLLFAARFVSGSPVAQASEVVNLGYFSPDELPEPITPRHRPRIADAIDGVCGVARSQDTTWLFGPAMMCRQLCAMRDRSTLDRTRPTNTSLAGAMMVATPLKPTTAGQPERHIKGG